MRKRKANKQEVILQSRDGDYVERIEWTDWDTVKTHFVFTKDRDKAKVITMEDMYPPNATTSIGTEWSKGFAGGRVILL